MMSSPPQSFKNHQDALFSLDHVPSFFLEPIHLRITQITQVIYFFKFVTNLKTISTIILYVFLKDYSATVVDNLFVQSILNKLFFLDQKKKEKKKRKTAVMVL